MVRQSDSKSRGSIQNRTPTLHNAAMAVARPLDRAVREMLKLTSDRWPQVSRVYDSAVIHHRMRQSLGYQPNIRNPRTYNEKLGWRIIHDRNPLLATTTDKLAVRDYVAAKVGPDVLTPLLGEYKRAEDIMWNELPSGFVLKASHGCNMNIIVRDKSVEDLGLVRTEASGWLKRSFYEESREWAYRKISPRLLVEELLINKAGELPIDFKFLVFNGRTAIIRAHLDRYGDHRVNFYDPELNLLPIRQAFPTDPLYTPPPEVAGMTALAERIAEDFDYARIDLYLVDQQVRFGEITHYDGNARQRFRPDGFDMHLGSLWQLGKIGRPISSERRTIIPAGGVFCVQPEGQC